SADAAEPNDAGLLLEEVDTGGRAALPSAAPQRCVRCRNASGQEHDVAHGQFSGRDDVGSWSVGRHDASLGGCLYVYVVQAYAGTGDNLQVLCCGNCFCIYLGCRANEDCIYIGNGFEQLGAVRSVGLTNFKVGAECSNSCWGELFGQKYDWLVVRHGCGTFAISWADAGMKAAVFRCLHFQSSAMHPPFSLEFTHVTRGKSDFVKTFTYWIGYDKRYAGPPRNVCFLPLSSAIY